MRRTAFAGIVILTVAIAAALAIPRGGGRRDAQAASPAGGRAAQEARSVYVVVGPHPVTQRRQGTPAVRSWKFERWLGKHARYERWCSGDGSWVHRASGINLDTGEWWAYHSDPRGCEGYRPSGGDESHSQTLEPRTLFFADPPIADQARGVLSKGLGRLLAGEWAHLEACADLSQRKKSIAAETRSGRKVSVVTLIGGPGDTERRVLEFDLNTKHLLSMRFYRREEDALEQLIWATSSIQYDRPAPAHLATPPKAVRTAKATASISIETGQRDMEGYEGRMVALLVLHAAGRTLDHMIFPLENREHRIVPLELHRVKPPGERPQ